MTLWLRARPRRQFLRLALVYILAGGVGVGTAQACTSGPDRLPPLHQKIEIGALVRNATAIDVAVIEAVEPRDPVELARQIAQLRTANPTPAMVRDLSEYAADFGPAIYRYRLVKRLKGPPPRATTFELQGMTEQIRRDMWESPQRPRSRALTAVPSSRETIKEASPENLADSFCALYPFGWVGMKVLIFRGTDGGLLGHTIPHRQQGLRTPVLLQGSVYQPMDDPDDPWVVEMQRVLAEPPKQSR